MQKKLSRTRAATPRPREHAKQGTSSREAKVTWARTIYMSFLFRPRWFKNYSHETLVYLKTVVHFSFSSTQSASACSLCPAEILVNTTTNTSSRRDDFGQGN